MVLVSGTTTCRSGAAFRVTVTETWFSVSAVVSGSSLSATEYVDCPNDTVTAGTSSSVIDTVDSDVVPAVTPVGNDPRPNFTDSPSSSTVSEAAENVKVFSVSPEANVTVAGTPE